MFADVPAAGTLEIAPRVVDLRRKGGALAGEVTRRYQAGAGALRCEGVRACRRLQE